MNIALFLAQAKQVVEENLPAIDPVAEQTLPEAAAPLVKEFSIWSHILDSDPIVKLVLLLLVAFSVACWAIIIYKTKQLNSAEKLSSAFFHKFTSTGTISEMQNSKSLRDGPVYEVFMSGQESLSKIKKATTQYSNYYRDYLQQRIRQSREEEMQKLEQYVGFLATTASVAPFIGLFGTVWGILTAFLAIGQAGSSSLSTVGPYIAEALVATAVGLFAAIPAVVAYNYFVAKIKFIGKMIDMFQNEFMLKSEREMAS